MRQIICLRVCEPGGYMATYSVGEDQGGHASVVRNIEISYRPSDAPHLIAEIRFDTGESLCIPVGPGSGVTWRLAPEEKT